MNVSNDGLTLRYEAPDVVRAAQLSESGLLRVTIGVEPPSAGNVVEVRYRVDGGPFRSLEARETRTDYANGIQFFTATFPSGIAGRRVEYCPIATCAGRQVPAYGMEDQLLSSFVFAEPETTDTPAVTPPLTKTTTFRADLVFLARLTVQLKKPVVIGKTPEGLRLDFHAQSGTAKGAAFNAEVLENTADYMLVRPDGIGLINVRATLRTHDGALITAAYAGTIDFGEADGYERMARGDYPRLPRMQLSPRLLTEDSRYRYLNRLHLLGVGQVDLQRFVVEYDAYAVSTVVADARGKR